jgi:23S rRNA pseudouridine1911/1915/1917 synthase
VRRYLVLPPLADERLDRATAALTGLPRRRVRAIADAGQLWLNARPCRVLSRPLVTGDVIDVIPGDGEPLPAPPLPPPLPLLFEDGWLVAVDKPAGITTQPARRRREGELTAQERVALQLAGRDGQRSDVLLFHRLDRITTGVLLFARQHDAARALAAAWAGGRARKRYLAVVLGDPGPGSRVVDGPIAPDSLTRGRFCVDRHGKPAATEVRRLATAHGISLVEAVPRTGRTHQVRVHLAAAGVPVAGDSLYGGGSGHRPFLHAWRLALPHPRDGRVLALEAPLPDDMCAFMASVSLELQA